ncbi:hypothetical protein [Glycomyces artemisiae]|uniref:Lipoprotein n=1 Tax=Glycomyces artemisiae TaxID=1076443 RepID=A0A2T0UMD5_9ACTN|nr:hypothetical protein [Glycomyces artemisiae]PRY59066.1 hypothetical protein B0I28_104222 [Glycomyces artemisiae]
MRRLTALAALVLLFAAGCTGSDDPGTGEDPGGDESTAPPAPTAPLELTLEAPAGFTAAEGEDREVLFANDHFTYTFYVAGAEGGYDRIQVTSYLLSEGADTSSYDAQANLVTDYFGKLNQDISLDNYYPTVVHRHDGVYRFGSVDIDGVTVKWQDHFVFAGQYLIDITCSWDAAFAQVDAACGEMTSSFPFPEDFTATAAS